MGLSELIAAITRQEELLVFDRFDENMAWQLGTSLHERASAANWPVLIDIRFFHRPLFFSALPGSTPDNVEWARRKRNVVERYHKSSYRVGREMAQKGDTLANRYGLAPADFADHGGGFPITVHGVGVIGAIVVSGLAQEQDHMAIVRELCTLLKQDEKGMCLGPV